MYEPKVHLRDRKTERYEYFDSPHIYNAIKNSNWTLCHQIMFDERITDDLKKVTCKDCLGRLEHRFCFTAIEINGSTDREEIHFCIDFEQPPEDLMFVAKHWVINHLDCSKKWTVERDYFAEKL